MGKDNRIQNRKCLKCEQRVDDPETELCPDCEGEALEEIPHGLGFHGGMSPAAMAATHGGGWGSVLTEVISGTWVQYDDPLDQARADSMEGGE